MWPEITHSIPSLAVIAKHASPHRAWVVGVLESAVNAMYQWLNMNGYANVAGVMQGWGRTPILIILSLPNATHSEGYRSEPARNRGNIKPFSASIINRDSREPMQRSTRSE